VLPGCRPRALPGSILPCLIHRLWGSPFSRPIYHLCCFLVGSGTSKPSNWAFATRAGGPVKPSPSRKLHNFSIVVAGAMLGRDTQGQIEPQRLRICPEGPKRSSASACRCPEPHQKRIQHMILAPCDPFWRPRCALCADVPTGYFSETLLHCDMG